MTIEFADPSLNYAFIWWGIGGVILGIVLFFLPFFLTEDERKIAGWPGIGLLVAAISAAVFFSLAPSDYISRVDEATITQIQSKGFENIDLSGDRFTAATSDGEYFSGALVDLRPDSGYAYRIVELED